ncbi:MAG: Hpt domain-containing protein, partial [Rhodoferax sp.]
MQPNAAPTGDNELTTHDLGPLAWVLDELRKSLDGATKALRRFVRDAELARGSDLAALDASQLRIARQQLHQAVGALEMVGMAEPAKVLRAMEALAQKFVQRPELCSDEAANKVERASFALTEYLEGVLKGKSASSVALFPQYRDVLELVGDDRVHPADLWPLEWRWIDVAMPEESVPLAYDSSIRARLDGLVLRVVKSGEMVAAKTMRDISLGFAAAQSALEPRVFWKICGAYFEAVSLGLCPTDVYGKRAASRILLQYRTLARGEPGVSERLIQDLLFFCAQAVPADAADAPVLAAVRAAYGLTQTHSFDYETPQFGRFDPALLVQARKRIAAATETWSALAGGDTNRLKVATDQFSLVSDSVLKLHPESGDLARALTQAIEMTARSGEAPAPALAMEVATAVLFLEAAYEDMDPTDSHMTERSASLARRLEHVNAGGQTEPLERWMEDLYRRVSDRQIMGSVVDELRTTLGEVEKSLDAFFRNPQDKVPLHEVPSQLAQMRGVFSVLGLDQAALASLRMRGSVEKFLVDDIDAESARTGIFEKLGNSLGALGFLIDMLSYQRELAKKLFVYDEELGEFKPLMGREKTALPEVDVDSVAVDDSVAVEMPVVSPPAELVIEVAEPAVVAAQESVTAAPVEPEDDDELDLQDIFLEEAREVVQTAIAAIRDLAGDPIDLGQQTTLRRCFHTLKGSSRMVGLNEFGEAAWSMEQLLNTWLAEQKPASDDLLSLADKAMQGFDRWVEDIASGNDAPWSAQAFRKAADALRLDNRMVDLVLPGEDVPMEAEMDEAHPDFVSTQILDFDVTQAFEVSPDPSVRDAAAAQLLVSETEVPLDLLDFDFAEVPEVAELPLETAVAPDEVETLHPELAEVESAVAEFAPESQPAELADAGLEDQVKVIGTLRIDIPLYNVYLNEADEWSRRLLTELNEWALELPRPLSDTTVAWAHSLSGSSATVGFMALSEIARALEQALRHVQLHGQGVLEHAQVFIEAAEDIRRLLHQFAAGFLKEPDQALIDALKAILEIEFPSVAEDLEDSLYAELISEAEAPIELEALDELDEIDFDQLVAVDPFEVFEPDASEAPAIAHDSAEPAIPDQDLMAPVAVPPEASAGVTPAHIEIEPEDDDIDVLDVLDVDLFPIFEEEALELLPQLGGALRQWTARPDNLGARSEVLRVLHTLKGSARLAGAMHLGEMAHRMESAIERLVLEDLQASQLEPLLARFDAIQAHFDRLRATPEQALSLPEAGPMEQEAVAPAVSSSVPPAVALPIAFAATLTPVALRPVSNQTVRVRSQLLDRMVNQAGEVMITRSRLEARLGQLRGSLGDLTGNLDRLRHQLRDIELQSESQMQSRLAQAKDSAQAFDPLEFDRFTRVQELTRMMAESVHDVATVQRSLQRTVEGTEDDLIAQGRQARELQRDLLRTRMVEFEGIAERLYGVVRQASKDAGRLVKLDIVGGSLDMDRGVLERMAPSFEHLLRNSVAHGIEEPAVRAAAGKPAVGTITIHLQQQSNDVTVEFSDDGAGLDLDRIREKARTEGHLSDAASVTDSEAANLIFTPGFSTASQVTELAGRGIGLDVVRAEVNALGGRIETSTERGQGTKFTLVLPLTTAVTQVVMLRTGKL